MVLGESHVGKSSLVLRFVHGMFSSNSLATVAAKSDFSKIIELDEAKIQFDIWDTAGQERFYTLGSMFYRYTANLKL